MLMGQVVPMFPFVSGQGVGLSAFHALLRQGNADEMKG